MRRRGPDGCGAWSSERVGLGQVSLVTTPEAAIETQPWRHPESGCVIVSDSRLDNRPELLRELGLLHSPDKLGDCELFHAAYQKWGEDCALHLLGDFAVAIWDPAKQRLFCARDVAGVRPFYYHLGDKIFAFASETGSLLTLENVPATVDEGRIADALVGELEGLDDTSSFYVAITRLPPAHTLLFENGRARTRRYWHPLQTRPGGLPTSEEEWIEALLAQLTQAVRCRLRGSARVGSMLSGGVDSSSVVAIAASLLRAEAKPILPVFSGIASKGSCVETAAINSAQEALGLEATTTDVCALGGFPEVQRRFWNEMGEPFDGTMSLIGAQYHAAATNGVRAVMDGMPADNLYTVIDYIGRLSRSFQPIKAYELSLATHRMLSNSVPRLRATKGVLGAWAPRRLRDWRSELGAQSHYRSTVLGASLIDRDFAKRVHLRERYSRYRRDLASSVLRDATGQALSSMTSAYVTAAVERYGRVAAYHGVEPRHPYLDRRLVEFHAWVPQSLRFRGDWPKWILRKAVDGLLPRDVAWKRGGSNLGFRFNWAVIGGARETVARACEAVAPFVDAKRLHRALDGAKGGSEPGTLGLENAVLMGLWLGGYDRRAGL